MCLIAIIRTGVKPMKLSSEQKSNIVAALADKMLELGMNGTAVTPDVLYEHTDLTRAEIKEFAPDATELARARARRRK
jgi:hypothetical protein